MTKILSSDNPPNIKRSTMIWSLPVSDYISTFDLNSSENVSSDGNRIYVKMYINPEAVTLSESKIVNESLTKGGYVVQYWGEKNTTLNMNGSTGSSGIEGINVLRRIYRHEQVEYDKIIKARVKKAKDRIKAGVVENAAKLNNISSGPSLSVIPSAIADGLETIMDTFTGNKGSALPERNWTPISTHESLGALATTVECHYDGVIYQGYFVSFNFTESSQEPGLFKYQISFTVLRREGSRSNFMPWHRSPLDANGEPRSSSLPRDSYTSWNLTFPYSNKTFFRGLTSGIKISDFKNSDSPPSGFKPTSRK